MSESNFMFENRPNDIPSTELDVEGTIPRTLRGSFLSNGPGQIFTQIFIFGSTARTQILREESASE